MVKLQNLINKLTKANIPTENILINILASVLVYKNEYNINDIKEKYNIEVEIGDINNDINNDIICKILDSKDIIKYLFTNYNFKNLNVKPEVHYKYINYILKSVSIDDKNILLLSSQYGEFNSIFRNEGNNMNIDIYDLFNENIIISQMDYDINYNNNFNNFNINNYYKQIIICN